jgi:hypothetical protein
MSRDLAPEPREIDSERAIPNERPDLGKRFERERSREIYNLLSPREKETLFDLGRFRTIAVEDLLKLRYAGKRGELNKDLESWLALGLVQKRTALVAKGRLKLNVMVLTKAGRRAVQHHKTNTAQAIYSGFVKPGEVAHDAAIYRMFHKEAALIENAKGSIKRVVLDYELKRKVYSPLAKARHKSPAPSASEYARLQEQVACENHLKVVNGKIPLPDLRIEYETVQGETARVDLELATHHYHGSHLREKAAAGFKMYGDADATRRSPVFEEREITAAILSL